MGVAGGVGVRGEVFGLDAREGRSRGLRTKEGRRARETGLFQGESTATMR